MIYQFNFPQKSHYSTGPFSVLSTEIAPGFVGGFKIRLTKIECGTQAGGGSKIWSTLLQVPTYPPMVLIST
jgi:hypothetical protein